jgi:WD40-like Beta Propeller Repeat
LTQQSLNEPPAEPLGRRRRAVFLAACVLAVLTIFGYVAYTSSRSIGKRGSTSAPERAELVDSVPDAPVILFRDASPGPLYGRIAVVTLSRPASPRRIAPISCERVHYAAGWGVCMMTDESRLPARYSAFIFDRSFQRHHTVTLTGPPIRARVSPDGRRAALTVFEQGHSYADAVFSTRTIVLETSSGREVADLEAFAVEKDGVPFKSVDFNFWGVTFARDGDQFFATLKTHGQRYLVKGSIDARRVTVVRPDVECPSLSPDGSRLVFKKPLKTELGWHLYVLDLSTGIDRPLNQSRPSVDDQVDWFDEQQVVYHDSASEGTGIWVLPVDGVTPPQLLLSNAYSPAVQR